MATKTKKTSAAKKTTKAAVPAVPATTLAPVVKPVVTVTPVVKAAAPVAPASKNVNAAERAKLIEVTAYLIAEKNGFRGDSKAYWLQAERDVEAKLGKK